MVWAAAEAHQLLSMLGRHNPDAIWMVTPQWDELLFVGDAYKEIYNHPITDDIERDMAEFIETVHPEDREQVKSAFGKLADEKPVDVEYRLDNDGFPRHVWVKARPIYSKDGEFVAIGGFSREFTERKQYEKKIEHKNNRLEKFASIISHDLRNPLNVANLHLELVREKHTDEHTEKIAETLDRMEEIISETLQLAQQGKTVAETDQIELATLARECWEDVETDEAQIRIEESIRLRGDRGRLKHVFENLFRNAVEHGDSDITATVGTVERMQVSTRTPGTDKYAGFYISDDGPGVPVQRRETLFDTGYTDGEGGLGLPIVKDIIEAHNWSIRVTESRWGGARFEITNVDVVDESGV